MSDARPLARCYRTSVDVTMSHAPGAWMADLAAALGSRFGDRLTLVRTGNHVGWSYAGQAAFVSLAADGTIDATFGDVPADDAVAGGRVRCLYRPAARPARYALSRDGCARMVDDMVAFFSYEREPRFVFVDTRAE